MIDILERLWSRHIELDSKRTEHEEEMLSEAIAEIGQLRDDLALRNQTALDRKEIIRKLEAVLEMGIQLAESGGHGSGKDCPTCHFMREAQAALGWREERGYDPGMNPVDDAEFGMKP